MQLYLEKKPSLNELRDRHNANTIFHCIAKKGSNKILRLIITYCRDQNIRIEQLIKEKNIFGMTPLASAALFCRTRCIKLLLKQKAEINANNINGDTPLHHAARLNLRGKSKREKACRILILAGADIDARNAFGCTPIQLADEHFMPHLFIEEYRMYSELKTLKKDPATYFHSIEPRLLFDVCQYLRGKRLKPAKSKGKPAPKTKDEKASALPIL